MWTPDQLHLNAGHPSALLPPDRLHRLDHDSRTGRPYQRLSLLESDGLDPLLIVITAERQVALALHGASDRRQLLMRSDPETLGALLALLDQRLQDQAPEQARALRRAIGALGPLQSSEQFGQRFWPCLAERLACMAPSLTLQTLREADTTNDLSLIHI